VEALRTKALRTKTLRTEVLRKETLYTEVLRDALHNTLYNTLSLDTAGSFAKSLIFATGFNWIFILTQLFRLVDSYR
jgi:hypothetical protein